MAHFVNFAEVVKKVGIDLHSAPRKRVLRRNQPTSLAGCGRNRNRDSVFRGASIGDGETTRIQR